MRPQEVIRKKRDGGSLSHSEMKDFFGGFLSGEVTDYQVSAMLMSIFHQGMERQEVSQLTSLMRDSGTVFSWPFDKSSVVDKHSTGGVGDKTSLVIMPLAILEGLKVPMISGRGLGHTGGTLDKLESLGIDVFPNPKKSRDIMEKVGGVFMGQTSEMVPLDRKLYSLRDVTATVESIPLIVASILSKKLSEGIGGLVMDIKFGTGAFMDTLPKAQQLAHELIAVGTDLGVQVKALVTSMNSPLGSYAGNALEVYECVEIMNGGGPESTKELILALTAEMVRLANPERALSDIKQSLDGHLKNGRCLEVFAKLTALQGGDVSLLENPESLIRAKIKKPLLAPQAGYIKSIDTRQLGLAVCELGGGRKQVTDQVDPWVGLSNLKRVGDKVEKGQELLCVHGNDQGKLQTVEEGLVKAYVISQDPCEDPLIVETI